MNEKLGQPVRGAAQLGDERLSWPRDALLAFAALHFCGTLRAPPMWNIIFGLIMLVGGLSGKLALIGTGSSNALAAVGAGVLIWGLYQEYKKRKAPGS